MKTALIAFAIAVTGCDDDTSYSSTTSEGDDHVVTAGEPGGLLVSYVLRYPDCDRPLLEFEVVTEFDFIGPARDCAWTFDDGTTSSTCYGAVELAPGMHAFTLRVRDPMTRAETIVADQANVYPPFEASLEVQAPAASRMFIVEAAAEPVSLARIGLSPPGNIVGAAERVGVGRHVVEVTAPGTYHVQLDAEHQRINGPLCSATMTRLVTIEP
jgi:hypothetical protein